MTEDDPGRGPSIDRIRVTVEQLIDQGCFEEARTHAQGLLLDGTPI